MSDSYPITLEAPLRDLLFMQTKGKFRQTWKKLSSPRRAIPTIFVAVLMLLYVAQIYIALALNTQETTVPIESVGPLGMFTILMLKLLGVCIDRKKSGAGYRHEEVHCLLGGPFTHQQVRLYRTLGHLVSIFFTSVFAAVFFRFHVTSFVAALCGSFLAMMFTYLVYSTIAVIALKVSERVYQIVRSIGCGLALGTLAYLLYRVSLLGVSNLEFIKAFGYEAIALSNSTVWQILMSPFTVFTNVIMAETPGQWAKWMLPSLLLNYVSLQCLMRVEVFLDRRSIAREREAFADREQSLRYLDSRKQKLGNHKLGVRVTWINGVGPIVWRQVKALSRLKGGLGWLLIPLGLAFAAGGYIAFDPNEGALQAIAVIVVLTSVFLPGLLPFDFRGDLKGLPALKMMPIEPRSVVLGQLVVPVALLFAFQVLALSSLLLHDRSLVGGVLLTMCFLLPTNTAIIALENLIFLLYPYRVAEFDAQATVRRIVMLMAKFCVVFLAAIISCLAGLGIIALKMALRGSPELSRMFSQIAWPLIAVSQLIALSVVAALVVSATCWAYRRFDLSEDLPS